MKQNKGITLIALVITIIVLLILAGISIAMLSGQNGILNRSSEAKYENVMATVDEQVRLSQLSLKTTITSKMMNSGGYVATANKDNSIAKGNFADLVKEVKDGLNATMNTAVTEGYAVYDYLTPGLSGTNSTNGTGYILITYSNNSLRSSLPKEGIKTTDGESNTFNGLTYTTALASGKSWSNNQAVLAYVIRVSNYNCELSGGVLTTAESVSAAATAERTAAGFYATAVGAAAGLGVNGQS